MQISNDVKGEGMLLVKCSEKATGINDAFKTVQVPNNINLAKTCLLIILKLTEIQKYCYRIKHI